MQAETLVLEQWEFYRKQNYFNRMCIKTPESVLKLSIPIRKAKEYSPIRERIISYDWKWQRDHWRSLESAYRSSPYFEYYEDRIEPFFREQPEMLLDYNLRIIDKLSEMLGIELNYSLSESYQEDEAYDRDLRSDFDPKRQQAPAWFEAVAYPQVFGEEFAPDLSVLDLLFNCGPESVRILRESMKNEVGS